LNLEIERLQKEPVEKQELEKVKNQLESSFIYSQDSLFAQAMLLARHEVALSWKATDDYLPPSGKLPGRYPAGGQQYLIPDNRTVGILVPCRRKKDKLHPSGPH